MFNFFALQVFIFDKDYLYNLQLFESLLRNCCKHWVLLLH